MKKYYLFFALLFSIGAFAQNNIVIQQNTSSGSNTYNSSNEVKGVEYTLEYNSTTGTYHIICENYNSFAVSCEYNIQSLYNNSHCNSTHCMGDVVNEQSGDFVIRANEKRSFDTRFRLSPCTICKINLNKFKSYRL